MLCPFPCKGRDTKEILAIIFCYAKGIHAFIPSREGTQLAFFIPSRGTTHYPLQGKGHKRDTSYYLLQGKGHNKGLSKG